MKKPTGVREANHGMIGETRRIQRGNPGTSAPMMLTPCWNIWVWWHSSVASWVRYRNSADPLSRFAMYCMIPRIRMFSNCSPTFMMLAWRHSPISIWVSTGNAWYQGWAPSGSTSAGRTQRTSVRSTRKSGWSQGTSTNASKWRRTEASDRRRRAASYSSRELFGVGLEGAVVGVGAVMAIPFVSDEVGRREPRSTE